MLHIPIVHADNVSKQMPRGNIYYHVETLTNAFKLLLKNWFMSQLCVHQDMKHFRSLESAQEAKVALGYASSNSYASFVLSKLPVCLMKCTLVHEPIINYY